MWVNWGLWPGLIRTMSVMLLKPPGKQPGPSMGTDGGTAQPRDPIGRRTLEALGNKPKSMEEASSG